MDGFRIAEAASITGVGAKTLAYWDQTNFLRPGVTRARGTGTRRLYNFRDLVAIRAVRELRARGISLQELRRVVAYLRKQQPGADQPLRDTFLLTDGNDVYIRTGETLVSALRQPDQALLFHVLDLTRTEDEVRQEVVRLEQEVRARNRAQTSSEAS